MQQFEKSESVRVFIKKYNQYVNEFNVLYEKILSVNDNAISSEPARPVALKVCVDTETDWFCNWLGLIMDTEIGQAVTDYEKHWDKNSSGLSRL